MSQRLAVPQFASGTVKKVYCDMDGVLADLAGYARNNWGVEIRFDVPGCISKKEFWKLVWEDYAVGKPTFRKVGKTPWAKQVWNHVLLWDPDPVLLSVGAKGELQDVVAKNKFDWVRENLGDFPLVLVDSYKHKADYAGSGVLLVDDNATTCALFEKAGGMTWKIG